MLTNEVVTTAEEAWKVVLAYARRWRIEMTFRNLKSELAIQSLRVYDWEARLKLLGMLTLAYAFLMDVMRTEERTARDWLIDYACHRTGEHLREVELPFTRLRIALAKLWLAYPCGFVRRAALRLYNRTLAHHPWCPWTLHGDQGYLFMSFFPQQTRAPTLGTGKSLLPAPILHAPRLSFFCRAFFSFQKVIPETERGRGYRQ